MIGSVTGFEQIGAATAPIAQAQAQVNAAQSQVNNAQANLNQAAANQVQKTKPVREAQQAAAQMQSKAATMQSKAAQMQNTAAQVKNAPQTAKAMANAKVNQVKATPAALKNQLLSATRLTDTAFAKDAVLKRMGVDAIAAPDGKTLRLVGTVATNADKYRAQQLALKNFKNVKNEIVISAAKAKAAPKAAAGG